MLRPAEQELHPASLERSFTLRANEGFVETFAARLVAAISVASPGVGLRFAPKPDKDVRPLREGLVDLEIGVLGDTAPEIRVQTLFRDHFVGAVRRGHTLLDTEVTPERYAACRHVAASRRGRSRGPVDDALAALGLKREIVVVVPGFPAALAIACASDLVALVPSMFLHAEQLRHGGAGAAAAQGFALPVRAAEITVSQMWHPRLEADPAHRWLRTSSVAEASNSSRESSNLVEQPRRAFPNRGP